MNDLSRVLSRGVEPEIVSADSRQVYRGLDIGTAKVTTEEMQGFHHHMIDIADPSKVYSVAEYQKEARKIIADIHAQRKDTNTCWWEQACT